jgi:methionyl-tRNA synthetase
VLLIKKNIQMTPEKQEPQENIYCSNCGTLIEHGNRYCTTCGAYIVAEGVEVPCKRCGTPIKGNFCPRCGRPLEVSEKEKKKLEGKKITANPLFKAAVKLLEEIVKFVSFILDSIFGVNE